MVSAFREAAVALRTRPRMVAVALLVAVSAAWGSTFVVVKAAVAHAPVLEFLAWRFLLAGSVLVALRPAAVLRLAARGWAQGSALGGLLAGAYVVQTYALVRTPAAVSGLLTGLQVVFTPVLVWALLRQRPAPRLWAGTALAAAGLAAITVHGLSISPGESLTVLCAVLFALQIVGVERWSSLPDAWGLATVQLLTVGVVCMLVQLPRTLGLPSSPGAWWAVAVTALAATAFAFVVQSWAQAHLSATTASIVFTLEPVFAAVFAWGAGEPLGWSVLVGGGLLVAAMAVVGAGPPPTPRARPRSEQVGPDAAVGARAVCMAPAVVLTGCTPHKRRCPRGQRSAHRTAAGSDRLPPGSARRLGGRRAHVAP